MRHGGDAKMKITWFGYPASRLEFGSAVMLIGSFLPGARTVLPCRYATVPPLVQSPNALSTVGEPVAV